MMHYQSPNTEFTLHLEVEWRIECTPYAVSAHAYVYVIVLHVYVNDY